jgi:synaptic vesicle membrane protein VAT-1
MPTFDPMEMGSANKAVLAFNLSFFSNETVMLSNLFSQILQWIEEGKLQCPRIVEMPMSQVREAHGLLQSGATVGKIVLTTNDA